MTVLCLFALPETDIKLKARHWQEENYFNLFHNIYKEKIVKREIVNLKIR